MLDIFIVVLVLSPYALVPWMMTVFFKTRSINPLWLTYFLTFIALMIYPNLVDLTLSLTREVDPRRINCHFPMVFINVVLLPVSLLIQYATNQMIGPGAKAL